MSTVYEKLSKRVDYNISDESKEAIDYFFWIRPASQWKCNAAEFKQTFEYIDEVGVQYETTRISRVFRPLYWFVAATFIVHTICIMLQTMEGHKMAFAAYPIFRFLLMQWEVITLFLFVVFSQDALKGLDHIDQMKVVTQNFAGKCTDTLTQYNFDIDYSPYEAAAEKGRSLVMLPYLTILPVYSLQLLWTCFYLCRKNER